MYQIHHFQKLIFISIIGCIWGNTFGGTAVNGISISKANSVQYVSHLCSDGEGGAIIAWIDYRNESGDSTQGADIYAQRLTQEGLTPWTANGIAVCTARNDQFFSLGTQKLASDGLGGAILVWYDYRNTTGNLTQGADIYAQRINSEGSTLWTDNGVAICTAEYDQTGPTIIPDGQGDAIITWADSRHASSSTTDIYAQRVNSEGSTLWTSNGVAICTAANEQQIPYLISDGSGGAIITWYDYRDTTSNETAGSNIYAQRINSAGSTLWKSNGIAICTAVNDQSVPQLCYDGSSGAIITWFDFRGTTSNELQGGDIYGQRINGNGSTLWMTNGVAICTVNGSQTFPDILEDGSGGAIIGWWDDRKPKDFNIYAQHINGNGLSLWANNGVAICTATNNQQGTQLVSDGNGGAILTWWDYRYDITSSSSTTINVFAQRVNSNGSTLWALDGIAICTAKGIQKNPVLVSDGKGGAIITWWDTRNGYENADIYAAHIYSSGYIEFPLAITPKIWESFQ